jgi:hypothetical protein
MNRRIVYSRFAGIVLLAALSTLPLACGGGGGNILPPEGLTVSFQLDAPNPGAMTISMGAPRISGAGLQIPILVTGINEFFGAAFHVNFDPTTAEFVSFDATDSFIDTGGGVVVLIDATENPVGRLLVHATRQQGGGGAVVPGVTPVAPDNVLIWLNFRARAETGAAPNDFTFSNQEVNSCDGDPTCPVVDPASLTWAGGTMTAR